MRLQVTRNPSEMAKLLKAMVRQRAAWWRIRAWRGSVSWQGSNLAPAGAAGRPFPAADRSIARADRALRLLAHCTGTAMIAMRSDLAFVPKLRSLPPACRRSVPRRDGGSAYGLQLEFLPVGGDGPAALGDGLDAVPVVERCSATGR